MAAVWSYELNAYLLKKLVFRYVSHKMPHKWQNKIPLKTFVLNAAKISSTTQAKVSSEITKLAVRKREREEKVTLGQGHKAFSFGDPEG